jgi:hypothetical protein
LIKNTISSLGFLHHTHLKNIPTKLMGENPLKSDGKRHPSLLMENANNLLKNFDASVKKNRPRPPPLAGSQTPF